MKRCPQCNHVYTDDMMFCLSDGTPLVALLDEPDEATVVRPGRKETVQPAGSTGLWLKILAACVALFFGFIVLAGIAAWIFWPRGGVVIPGNENNSRIPTPTPTRTLTPTPTRTIDIGSNNNQTNLRSQQEEIERERKRLEDERRRLEEEKRKASPTPAPPFNDLGTTRITFRRGGVSETVSGTVVRQRTFVLRTLSGQNLAASVRSPGDCVTFSSGSSFTGYQTRLGDSYLFLRNNCSEPARFSLSVTVR
jgi:hypothetical protein